MHKSARTFSQKIAKYQTNMAAVSVAMYTKYYFHAQGVCMHIKKLFKGSTATLAFALSAIFYSQPAAAGYVDWASFTNFKTTDYEIFKKNVLTEVKNNYDNMEKAFKQLGKDLHDYMEEATVLGKTATDEYNLIIKDLNTTAVPTALTNSTSLTNAGVQTSIDNAQNAPGRIYLADVKADMAEFKFAHNPTEAIVMSAMINLRNRAKDSINVLSYLDANAKDYTCKSTGYRCTTLLALQEKVAGQIDTLQQDVVNRGSYWLDTTQRRAPADVQYSNTYAIGLESNADVDSQPKKIAAFLSPAPMLTAGFTPDTSKGALTPAKASVLADVLIGVNDFNSLQNFDTALPSPNKSLLQSKILTRFARVQLARHAISAVTSTSVQDAINSEFKMCVVRPNLDDTIGSSVEQHLTNIENLMRCNNLSLLHLRRVQMEQSRLIAVLLTTQLDQFSFQTADEESAAINNRDNK